MKAARLVARLVLEEVVVRLMVVEPVELLEQILALLPRKILKINSTKLSSF